MVACIALATDAMDGDSASSKPPSAVCAVAGAAAPIRSARSRRRDMCASALSLQPHGANAVRQHGGTCPFRRQSATPTCTMIHRVPVDVEPVPPANRATSHEALLRLLGVGFGV